MERRVTTPSKRSNTNGTRNTIPREAAHERATLFGRFVSGSRELGRNAAFSVLVGITLQVGTVAMLERTFVFEWLLEVGAVENVSERGLPPTLSGTLGADFF